MRDLIVVLIVFGSVPFILAQPYIGILMWSWVGYMNPHRMSWGFAREMPLAQIVALATVIGLIFTKESRRIPITGLTVIWILFIIWMIITTQFAFFPDLAYEQLDKVIKIQFATFLTLVLITNKERLNILIWVIVFSIGFFGVKGGFFTVATGGGYRVWGPPDTFIEDNNELALALLMIMPLMFYLRNQSKNKWIRLGLLASIILCAFAVLGSHSRGAFLAGAVVCGFYWLKSNQKIITGIFLILFVPSAIAFMPANWSARIITMFTENEATVEQVKELGNIALPLPERDWLQRWPNDLSALGRVNAWNYSINLANDKFFGGGFNSWDRSTFEIYAPVVNFVQAAHSIYFSVLADHGWVGLIFFVVIGILTWRTGSWIIRNTKGNDELTWAMDLAKMLQVSLVTYAVGGAFLSLSYLDLYWHLVALMVICKMIVQHQLQQQLQKSFHKDSKHIGVRSKKMKNAYIINNRIST